MNISFYISRRLSLSSSHGSSAPAVKVAVAAVALSVAVMLAAIAIVIGFKDQIREKIIGFNSHLSIYSLPDSESDADGALVTLDHSLSDLLDAVPYVDSYSLEISMPAILKTDDNFKGVYMKGFGAGADLSFLRSSIVSGRMPDFNSPSQRDRVLISQAAASQLSLQPGDTINTYFITDDVRVRPLKIEGIYNTHFEHYDDLFIFGQIGMMQQIAGVKANQGTAIKVMTSDFSQIPAYSRDMHDMLLRARADGTLMHTYLTTDAMQQGSNYFQWLAMLDTNVIVVLALMMAVACITLISGMLILIIDKTRLIGILRSLGMSNRRVARVFVYLSIRVALIGLLIGNALMLALLMVQRSTHFIPLDAEAYYFDYVPVNIDWTAIGVLNIGVTVIIFLSLLLPSLFVSRISPAKAMRYE